MEGTDERTHDVDADPLLDGDIFCPVAFAQAVDNRVLLVLGQRAQFRPRIISIRCPIHSITLTAMLLPSAL